MTEALYLTEPYRRDARATCLGRGAHGGFLLDRTVFFPGGGGQPADSGWLSWNGGRCDITSVARSGDHIELCPSGPIADLPVGTEVDHGIDWDRRSRHMRVHTALHLLSVVVPLPVTGGSIGDGQGRLDFDMPDAPGDREALAHALQSLVDRALPVHDEWITDEELARRPDLVKTMSVKPPTGAGKVRLVAIGLGDDRIDLQPCGGTHVANTGEIGRLEIRKIQKKGRQNRRFVIGLA